MSRSDPKMSSNLVRKPKMKNPASNRTRSTRSSVDKTVLEKGVYANARLTNVATSMVGCVVHVQVKNGGIYEGIFRTFSSKMEVVLELAHKLDEATGANTVPTRDRLVEKIIFKMPDIVSVTAREVDVDFANKDTFTDSAISKSHNGQTSEKELTPWEGDPTLDIDLDSGEASNGWDPNDMFKINRERFQVESSYDPSLKQYTTPLKVEDTAEYREKEARAAKLASEIEHTDQYKLNIDLENGDERDEEEKFSAVVRGDGGDQDSGKKYIPPHMRKGNQRGGMRGLPARHNNQSSPKAVPNTPQWPAPAQYEDSHRVNGEKDEKTEASTEQANPAESGSSPVSIEKDHGASNVRPESRKSSNPRRDEHKTLQDLKTFKETFKLQVGESKEKKTEWSGQSPPSANNTVTAVSVSISQASPVLQAASPTPNLAHNHPQQQPSVPVQNPHGQPSASPQISQPTSPQPKQESPLPQDKQNPSLEEQKTPENKEVEKVTEMVTKSTLNPNAKEFVFNPNAKPFTPQAPTPPRPQTQSPVLQYPGIGGPIAIQGQHLFPYVVNHSIQQVQPNQAPRFTHTPPKRAMVSVQRQEFTPAAQAAAATGQPIMAQPTIPAQTSQYTMQYIQQPGVMGHSGPMPQAYQMVPMHGQRVAATANMMVQTSHQSMDQQNMQQNATPAVFMSPQGPTAGNLAQHYQPHPSGAQPHHMAQPAHIAHHQHQPNPPHSQPSHMTSQTQGAHPSPSPVQHTPSQATHHPQQHPPSSGTPQPPFMFHNHGMAHSGQPGNHPPLQPSPHTPTSPQTMHPPNMSYPQVYPYTASAMQAGFQQQSGPQQPHHTTVTHSQHHHTHVPQIVMMPQPQGHQMQPVPPHHSQIQAAPAHLQQHHMQANNPAGPHMAHHQQGIAVSTTNTMHPHHIQYVHTQLAQQGHPAAAQTATIQFPPSQ